MAGAFQMLRSNDLIWSRIVRDYLMGERDADDRPDGLERRRHAHALPDASEYLRQLFLDNDLADGRYRGGRPAGRAVRHPGADVRGRHRDATTSRRGARSTRSISLADTDVTFVLTSGGHNAGIVSEPGHANRHFRIEHAAVDDLRVGPDEWLAAAAPQDGSWWTEWARWLDARSTPERVAPPPMGLPHGEPAALPDAPGTYVLQP